MDVVRARGRASAADVHRAMERPPSYSTVRSILSTLEEKGHLRHEREGRRFIYRPVVAQEQARRSALRHLLSTLFVGAPAGAFATLLDLTKEDLSDADLRRIESMIENVRDEQP